MTPAGLDLTDIELQAASSITLASRCFEGMADNPTATFSALNATDLLGLTFEDSVYFDLLQWSGSPILRGDSIFGSGVLTASGSVSLTAGDVLLLGDVSGGEPQGGCIDAGGSGSITVTSGQGLGLDRGTFCGYSGTDLGLSPRVILQPSSVLMPEPELLPLLLFGTLPLIALRRRRAA